MKDRSLNMRHVPFAPLLVQILAEDTGHAAKKSLVRAHKKLARKIPPADRTEYTQRNGPRKWKPIKDGLINLVGRKCWYTEWEHIGGPLTVDHYRPVRHYWWLAYDERNYRLACPWANSPEPNEHGQVGGKGENFPLLPPGQRARGRNALRVEKPVILDPCNAAADCNLLAFHSDGRPILNPDFAANAAAAMRVEQSKILLNLDHAAFNSKREQLCRDIALDVNAHEELDPASETRPEIRERIRIRLSPAAPFSVAARYYVRLHRHLGWVEDLLNEQ